MDRQSELKLILPSERSPSEKDADSMISAIQLSGRGKLESVQRLVAARAGVVEGINWQSSEAAKLFPKLL